MNPRRGLGPLLLAGCLGGLSTLALAPVARADGTSSITPQTEGWYQSNPSCHAPSICVTPAGAPAPNPYPARSLHVGFSAGRETARSYLALPLPAAGGDLSSGWLTVPLDTSQVHGSQSPERAALQVCLTEATITAVDGSLASPPAPDCSGSATVVYLPTPTLHLLADLAPLLGRLPRVHGLVLLADPVKAAQTDTWRVVFSAHDRTDAARTAPATVTLTAGGLPRDPQPASPVRPADGPVPADPLPADPPPSGPVAGLAGPTPDRPLPPVGSVVPEVATPAPEPAPTVVLPAALSTRAAAVRTAQTVTTGYAYPGVWLLPLGLLVLVPITFRALTRDLTPAP